MVFWQVDNPGSMAGQFAHFVNYAPGEHSIPTKCYTDAINLPLAGQREP